MEASHLRFARVTSKSNELQAVATFGTKGVIRISAGPTCSMYVNPTRTEANTSCYCDVGTESEMKLDPQMRETLPSSSP